MSISGCHMNPADIVFVLDDSDGVGRADFETEVDFVTKFAKFFEIGPSKTQIGVITYSIDSSALIPLNQFHDTQAFVNHVHQLPYIHRSNDFENATAAAFNLMFTTQYGDRPAAKNIMIVFKRLHAVGKVPTYLSLPEVDIFLGIPQPADNDIGLHFNNQLILGADFNGTDNLLPRLTTMVCQGKKH